MKNIIEYILTVQSDNRAQGEANGLRSELAPIDLEQIELAEGYVDAAADGMLNSFKQIQNLGTRLYAGLFPNQIHGHFREQAWRKMIEDPQQETYIRLRLVFQDGVSAKLLSRPWEFMYSFDEFISTHAHVSLSCSYDNKLNIHPGNFVSSQKPLRVLFVHTHPEDLDGVGVISLRNEIAKFTSIDAEFDELEDPTPQELVEKVGKFRPHVFHFLGHGSFGETDGEFALRKPDGNALWYDAKSFSSIFSVWRPSLAVLQSCSGGQISDLQSFTGGLAWLVRQQIPSVVAMRYPFEQHIGWKFSQSFYAKLSEGGAIDLAVQAGRRALAYMDDLQAFSTTDFGSPILWTQHPSNVLVDIPDTTSTEIHSNQSMNSNASLIPGELLQEKSILISYLSALIRNTSELDPGGTSMTYAKAMSAMPLDEIYVGLQAIRDRPDVDRRVMQEELDEIKQRLQKIENPQERENQYHIWAVQARPIEQTLKTLSTKRTDLFEIIQQYSKLVILGDPGAGKTTLLRYLALHFSRAIMDDLDRFLDEGTVSNAPTKWNLSNLGPVPLPILMRISKYAEARDPELGGDPDLTIIDYLPRYFIGQFQLPFQPDELAPLFKKYLKEGRCLVLFDGLDEIIDPVDRHSISSNIHNFASTFSLSTRESHEQLSKSTTIAQAENFFVVTSRIAGYHFARVPGNFEHFTIQAMSNDDIERFLKKWCPVSERYISVTASESEIQKRAQQEIDSIMGAVKNYPGVRRMAQNPLLLRILAVIHRNERHLPQRRIELYETATLTLLRDWNLGRGLGTEVIIDEHRAQGLLGPIAFWIHENRPSGLLTKGEVEKQLSGVLAVEQGLSPDNPSTEIKGAVARFLETVRFYSGIFVERGEGLYGFMHLTFEEYFTARHMVSRSSSAQQMIINRLHQPRWREPILLAIGYMSKSYYQDTDELLRAILNNNSDYESILHRDLIFTADCIGDSVNVTPLLVKELATKLLGIYLDQTKRGRYRRLQEQIENALQLLNNDQGNEAVEDAVANLLTSCKNSKERLLLYKIIEKLSLASPSIVQALGKSNDVSLLIGTQNLLRQIRAQATTKGINSENPWLNYKNPNMHRLLGTLWLYENRKIICDSLGVVEDNISAPKDFTARNVAVSDIEATGEQILLQSATGFSLAPLLNSIAHKTFSIADPILSISQLKKDINSSLFATLQTAQDPRQFQEIIYFLLSGADMDTKIRQLLLDDIKQRAGARLTWALQILKDSAIRGRFKFNSEEYSIFYDLLDDPLAAEYAFELVSSTSTVSQALLSKAWGILGKQFHPLRETVRQFLIDASAVESSLPVMAILDEGLYDPQLFSLSVNLISKLEWKKAETIVYAFYWLTHSDTEVCYLAALLLSKSDDLREEIAELINQIEIEQSIPNSAHQDDNSLYSDDTSYFHSQATCLMEEGNTRLPVLKWLLQADIEMLFIPVLVDASQSQNDLIRMEARKSLDLYCYNKMPTKGETNVLAWLHEKTETSKKGDEGTLLTNAIHNIYYKTPYWIERWLNVDQGQDDEKQEKNLISLQNVVRVSSEVIDYLCQEISSSKAEKVRYLASVALSEIYRQNTEEATSNQKTISVLTNALSDQFDKTRRVAAYTLQWQSGNEQSLIETIAILRTVIETDVDLNTRLYALKTTGRLLEKIIRNNKDIKFSNLPNLSYIESFLPNTSLRRMSICVIVTVYVAKNNLDSLPASLSDDVEILWGLIDSATYQDSLNAENLSPNHFFDTVNFITKWLLSKPKTKQIIFIDLLLNQLEDLISEMEIKLNTDSHTAHRDTESLVPPWASRRIIMAVLSELSENLTYTSFTNTKNLETVVDLFTRISRDVGSYNARRYAIRALGNLQLFSRSVADAFFDACKDVGEVYKETKNAVRKFKKFDAASLDVLSSATLDASVTIAYNAAILLGELGINRSDELGQSGRKKISDQLYETLENVKSERIVYELSNYHAHQKIEPFYETLFTSISQVTSGEQLPKILAESENEEAPTTKTKSKNPLDALEEILKEAKQKQKNLEETLIGDEVLQTDNSEKKDLSVDTEPIAQSLENQSIFTLLGTQNTLSDDEKEAFLNKLQLILWNDFLENDVSSLITSEEYKILTTILKKDEVNASETQEEAVIFLENRIPDLEDILLEKALELKEKMIVERVSLLKEKYINEDKRRFRALITVENLFSKEQWKTGADILEAIEGTDDDFNRITLELVEQSLISLDEVKSFVSDINKVRAFSYKNTKGQTYYLHSRILVLKNGREQQIYFFARDVRDGALEQIPEKYEVVETKQTGMPVLRKII